MKKKYEIVVWRIVLVAGLSLAAVSCSADGSALFREKGCIQCHSFKGEGGRMGPDLTAVGDRLTTDQIRNYIRNPSAVNPNARMPTFSHLSSIEIRALASYLQNDEAR